MSKLIIEVDLSTATTEQKKAAATLLSVLGLQIVGVEEKQPKNTEKEKEQKTPEIPLFDKDVQKEASTPPPASTPTPPPTSTSVPTPPSNPFAGGQSQNTFGAGQPQNPFGGGQPQNPFGGMPSPTSTSTPPSNPFGGGQPQNPFGGAPMTPPPPPQQEEEHVQPAAGVQQPANSDRIAFSPDNSQFTFDGVVISEQTLRMGVGYLVTKPAKKAQFDEFLKSMGYNNVVELVNAWNASRDCTAASAAYSYLKSIE